MYAAVCSSPFSIVRARLSLSSLHSTTNRLAGPVLDGQTISRSTRRLPSAYSRSMRPAPFTTRCRNACRTSCGPASLYCALSTQCSEFSRKNS